MATSSIWNPALIRPAIGDALKKLNPRTMMKNPVMFVVEIGSLLTSIAFIRDRSLLPRRWPKDAARHRRRI
jgi:high-affinity K+ transport system ATPase subunit B